MIIIIETIMKKLHIIIKYKVATIIRRKMFLC